MQELLAPHYDYEALWNYRFAKLHGLELDLLDCREQYCDAELDYCEACGIPCLCVDGPICLEHLEEDNDMISPEDTVALIQQGIKIPMFPPGSEYSQPTFASIE